MKKEERIAKYLAQLAQRRDLTSLLAPPQEAGAEMTEAAPGLLAPGDKRRPLKD